MVVAAIASTLFVIWLVGIVYFRRWVAHNDFAVFRLELEQTLAGNIRLRGAYSRLGLYHPGPVRTWVFAIPYWLSGRRVGALRSTALVLNLLWVVAALWMAGAVRWRRVGIASAIGLLVVAVAMRQQFASPWNPHLAILPMYVACWAAMFVVLGHRWAWWLAVVGASFAAQLHAAALLVGGAVVLSVFVADWRSEVGASRWRSVGLTALLWCGPLIDLVHGRDANLARLVTVENDARRIGLSTAVAHVARLIWPPTVIDATAVTPNIEVWQGWSRWLVALLVGFGLVLMVRGDRDGRRLATGALLVTATVVASIALFIEPPYRYLYGPLQAAMVFVVSAVCASAAVLLARADTHRPIDLSLAGFAVVGFTVSVFVASTRVDDGESAARRALGLEPAVERVLADHPEWGSVQVINADLQRANVSAELADIVYRAGRNPRSRLLVLDIDAPRGTEPAFVAAMGRSRDCLLDAGVEPIAEGLVPSVDQPLAVFAIAGPDDRGAECVTW